MSWGQPGCNCAVCRDRRAELEAEDREPNQEPVVHEHHHHHVEERVEHHDHYTTEEHHHNQRAKQQPRPRERRRHSVLRFLLVGAVLVWVLHSFYPGLNVPLVPGIACTNGTAQAAGFGDNLPGPDITPLPGTPGSPIPNPIPKLGDLAKDTIGHAIKKVALLMASTAIRATGATIRAMAAHPPKVADIATGLHHDVETVGRVVGFMVAAFQGASPVALTDTNAGTEAVAAPSSGCGACPSQAAPAVVQGAGINTAARAVLRAGTGWDPVMALAVAGAESSYDPTARNASSASGLFQMKYPMHADLFGGASWKDPYANARAAYRLWRTQGWQPWVTVASGAYRSHLAAARAALARVQGSSGAVTPAVAVRPVACDTGPLPAATHTPGLRHVARVAEAAVRRFGFTGTIGGYANRNIGSTGVLSKHALGLAIDVMVEGDRTMGNRLAAYFAGPGYGKYHVDNVIYFHRIYNAARGWHNYAVPPGGSPHYDHVHIDFN